ncbi:hypothetical protein B0A54_01066 [Friedmanniomyces endolithicus]|uniref:Uncharacterized protein n=1 Tax=Friedmanniomyces endolithicus TaxID=329885 RepID=A0A4U0VIC8_9PEZI|nr:hypothetical protein B0A54_01066 [Friedmanniomyces endolithicus]
MVNLSLQHRVKFEKQATLLSETSHDGPNTALLGLAAAIAVLNVLFLVNGAVIAAIIDWTWYRETGLSHQSWYKDDSIDAYAYHSAVEETEMQTDRDMPDRSAAHTPVPQDASSRLPSYPAASAFDEHLAPEKERDMV